MYKISKYGASPSGELHAREVHLSGDFNVQHIYIVIVGMVGTKGDTYATSFERTGLVERDL